MELHGEQKEIADAVVRIFCLNILFVALGNSTMPFFFPILAMEYDLTGEMIGLVLALPCITMMISIPFIKY